MKRKVTQDMIAGILDLPREGELQVCINGERRLGTRFNDCAVSQNCLRQQMSLTLTARVEQKQASLTINTLNDQEVIKRSIQQIFDTVKHMPDDEEVMPALGQVIEDGGHAFDKDSESTEIEDLGNMAAAACKKGEAAKVDLAGLVSLSKSFTSYGDSEGGFAFERFHRADYHVTSTGAKGSGWAENQGVSFTLDDVMQSTERAIKKGEMAQDAKLYEPKPTTVVLEPQAVGELVLFGFYYGFDQRGSDEGRSAFATHKDDLGKLSLYSDPTDAIFPSVSFNGGGEELGKSVWLDQGKQQQLITSRYWAAKQNIPSKPFPKNLILSGEGQSLEDLIKSTEDGILVNRFWYIRSTDAKSLAFTGMTRDGVYRIENGEVTYPVRDMRWNDSAIRVLSNVEASGKPVATGEDLCLAMPALKVKDFQFTSLSN
jgi:predicted Zn-dependent protease